MDEHKIIRGRVEGKEKYCRIPIRRKRKTDEEISAAIENLEAIEIIDAQEDTGMVTDAPKEIYEAFGTAISAMQELQQYRAIGTVEECREARELQQAKRPLLGGNPDMPDTDIFICPACSGVVGIDEERAAYCADCGQAIDWGGEEK